jgi:hypothetical protein
MGFLQFYLLSRNDYGHTLFCQGLCIGTFLLHRVHYVYIEGKLVLCWNSHPLHCKSVSLIEPQYKHCVKSRALPLSCLVWSVRAVVICEVCGESNFERWILSFISSRRINCGAYLVIFTNNQFRRIEKERIWSILPIKFELSEVSSWL